jgi:hypothetical protein
MKNLLPKVYSPPVVVVRGNGKEGYVRPSSGGRIRSNNYTKSAFADYTPGAAEGSWRAILFGARRDSRERSEPPSLSQAVLGEGPARSARVRGPRDADARPLPSPAARPSQARQRYFRAGMSRRRPSDHGRRGPGT